MDGGPLILLVIINKNSDSCLNLQLLVRYFPVRLIECIIVNGQLCPNPTTYGTLISVK